jgi:hypothetical protein
MRSSERPATHNVRPVAFATAPSVASRAAFEAKVVTITLPFAAPTASSSPSYNPPSVPDASALKALVESQTRTSTPSSPIAVSAAALDGVPSTGSASSFQSPVWKTRPYGVSITAALISRIEWASGRKRMPKGPSLKLASMSTTWTLTCFSSPSSISLPAISPAVKRLA